MSKLSQVYAETKETQFEPKNLLNALVNCNQRSSSQGDDGEDGDDDSVDLEVENLSIDTNQQTVPREVFHIE
jgi:hypothetical protein